MMLTVTVSIAAVLMTFLSWIFTDRLQRYRVDEISHLYILYPLLTCRSWRRVIQPGFFCVENSGELSWTPNHKPIQEANVLHSFKKKCCHLINNTRYQYIKYFNKLSWSCLFKVLTLANHRASQGDGLWRRSLSRSLEIGGNFEKPTGLATCMQLAGEFLYISSFGMALRTGFHPGFCILLRCFCVFFCFFSRAKQSEWKH